MKSQTPTQTKKILVVMGTRPEVIKLAPVIEALKDVEKSSPNRAIKTGMPRVKTVICLTGQHREMVDPFLKIFGIKPDYDLRVMQPDQHLGELTGRVLAGMKKVLEAEKPDWLLVQGDTTSALAAALALFLSAVLLALASAGGFPARGRVSETLSSLGGAFLAAYSPPASNAKPNSKPAKPTSSGQHPEGP